MRQINREGFDRIKQWEGFIGFAYDDFDPPARRRKIMPGDKVYGTLTIGYGHTGSYAKPGATITQDQAELLLLKALIEYETAVETAVKVDLTDNQFAALVSFCYNIGPSAFRNSTLVRKLNAGDYAAVPVELMKWTKSKGKFMQGLANRRAVEAALWAKGAHVQSSGTPAQVAAAPLLDRETVSWGAGILSTVGASMTGDGPLQYVLAGVVAVSFAVGLYLFLKRRRAG